MNDSLFRFLKNFLELFERLKAKNEKVQEQNLSSNNKLYFYTRHLKTYALYDKNVHKKNFIFLIRKSNNSAELLFLLENGKFLLRTFFSYDAYFLRSFDVSRWQIHPV